MQSPLVVAIGGPTASGKTTLAIRLAQTLGTEIINADSRQFYRELNIGVARPSEEELRAAKHHFVASESIFKPLSAGSFATKAREVLLALLETHGIALVTGGSGLYIQALLYGFDELGTTEDRIRDQVSEIMKQGVNQAMTRLEELSPGASNLIDIRNPVRVQRALELVIGQNRTLEEIRKGKQPENPFRILGFYLNPQREALYRKIENRVDQMFAGGFLEEARALYEHRNLKALQTVGYSELFEHFSGQSDLKTAVDLIKQHTRNYAKRQLTWFRNRTTFAPADPDTAYSTILKEIEKHGYTIHQ